MQIQPCSWICWPIEFSPSTQEAPIDRLDSLEVETKQEVICQSFHAFLEEYETEIFPHYEKHEKSFDSERIHSRMHVARALIFCEVMARYYTKLGIDVNFPLLRRAIGLHDAGRRGNGEDVWEEDSAKILSRHLRKKGVGYWTAKSQANIVVKDGTQKSPPIEYYLAQSGDCLDIIRCYPTIYYFRKELLTFLNHKPLTRDEKMRDQLIEEASRFIRETERRKHAPEFSQSKGFMQNLLQVIEKGDYPLLSVVLSRGEYQFNPSKKTYSAWLVEKIPTRPLRWITWLLLLPFHLLEKIFRQLCYYNS